jgi:hypothetical protein
LPLGRASDLNERVGSVSTLVNDDLVNVVSDERHDAKRTEDACFTTRLGARRILVVASSPTA